MLNNAYGLLTYVYTTADTLKTGINAIDLQIDAAAWDAIIEAAMPQIAAHPLSMSDEQLADAILLQFLGSTQAALLGENIARISPTCVTACAPVSTRRSVA
jgi:hypothetical protein